MTIFEKQDNLCIEATEFTQSLPFKEMPSYGIDPFHSSWKSPLCSYLNNPFTVTANWKQVNFFMQFSILVAKKNNA